RIADRWVRPDHPSVISPRALSVEGNSDWDRVRVIDKTFREMEGARGQAHTRYRNLRGVWCSRGITARRQAVVGSAFGILAGATCRTCSLTNRRRKDGLRPRDPGRRA